MENRIVIIDPASTEWNRGGYCYLPYLFYDALKYECGQNVSFLEHFTLKDINKIEEDDAVFVSYCTPPQGDMCLELHRQFPNAKFFGYYGFIEDAGLPMYVISPEQILKGMEHQGKSFEDVPSILMSDCDNHVYINLQGKIYPMHTSYACNRGCSFCPGSKNNNGEMFKLPIPIVFDKLRYYKEKGWMNIHLMDENFTSDIDRACIILEEAKRIGDFNFIVLGDSLSIERLTKREGDDYLGYHGVFLLEVGFEGFNLMGDKGGIRHIERCKNLTSIYNDKMFWLTMTFAPGETIETLNETGKFLKVYGREPNTLLPRIRTNSTEGGLGQFFQPYPNLHKKETGRYSPFNYTRLFPSFIPSSFYNDRVRSVSISPQQEDKFKYWCWLYNVYSPTWISNISKRLFTVVLPNEFLKAPYLIFAEECIRIAIACRLGIIK